MQLKKIETEIARFIRGYFAKVGKRMAVVGLSGGLDSAATLLLCARALGKKRVVALILPSDSTPIADVRDAKKLVETAGVRALFSNIEPALESFGTLSEDKISRANLSARIRMAILYSVAQKENGLVVGTGDKSELLLGYFTKYGDGGADLFPIGGLYKTEVREIARHLGVPAKIIGKPPSPALWKGQTAEQELGFSYETADAILRAIERGEKKPALVKKFGKKTVSGIILRMEKNSHKLLMAPVCRL